MPTRAKLLGFKTDGRDVAVRLGNGGSSESNMPLNSAFQNRYNQNYDFFVLHFFMPISRFSADF